MNQAIQKLTSIESEQEQLNRDTVEEFREYCFRAPALRFWQALRNWSSFNFIYASNVSPLAFDDYEHLPAATMRMHFRDTFYWKGKDYAASSGSN